MASSDIVVPSTSSPRDSDEVSSPSSSSTSLSAKEKKPDGETTAKETENEIVEEEKDVKSKPRKTVSFLHLDDDTSDKMKSSGVPPTLEENVDEEKTFDMSMDNTSLIMAAHASIDPSTPPELKAAAKVDAAVVALAVAENVKAAVENADEEPIEDRKDEDTSAQEADALGEAASDEIEKKPKKPKVVETSPSGRYVRFNDLLGEGAFKKVYRAYDTTQGVEVAWNQVKVANLPQSSRQRVVTEMKILQTLDHPSIIHFFSSFLNKETESVVFITEMMTSGTLKEFIQNRPVRLLIVKRWCKRILDALIYLHSHDPPIIHRDLKLDNIFINGSTGDIKIGDLGLASWQRNGAARSVLGTPEYMAPEMFEELYDEQVDIYAFGMCVLEMITKETPFMECTSTPQIYKKVIAGVVPDCFNRLVESPAKEFINECIKMRPPGERRPSAVELKKHPFLAKDPNNQDADGIDCQDLLKAGTQAVTSHPTTSLDGDDASVNFPKPPKPQSTVKEVFNGEPPPTNPSQLPNEDLPPSEVPTQPVSDSQPQHGQSELNTGVISATPPQQQVEEQGLQQEAPLSVPTPTVTPPPSLSQQQQVESTPQNDVNESAHPLERIPSSDLPATIRVTLCAGTAVEARFDGGDVWSPGKIDRINNDGTFAIRYEDQEYESSVSPDLIRLSSESGHQYNLGEVYRHQTKSAEETGEGPFDRQITIEASLLSQGGFSSATSTVRPGSAPPMPSSSIPEHGSDTPRSQSPVPVSIPPTSTIQQQQPQQEPIQKPGSPVPTSELPPRHPAMPQQTQMTRPHTAQPSGNNIPKAPSSVSSLPSTLLGRFWRMSAVKQGPSPSQPGAPDPLAIKFTLRNTQKKTKQTVDFDFDMVSDVATQVARELVETMSLSPSDADHIARVLDGFVRDYRNFQGSPEQFAAQAEQPGYPQRPLQPPQQQQPPPQQQQQQQPPPQQQQQQQQQPPPQQQQQQQQQPPPQQPQQQQQQQQQTTSAGQQASQSQSGGQGVDFYESLMKQVHQNFEEQKLKHQRDLESIAKMKEQHLRRMNAGTQQPSQQHQRSGGVASGVKPTIDGNASVGASSVGSVSDTEQVDLFDDSEEAKQRRRELAEKKMREEKEMIRLRKMKEAEEAEKKLFAMENLSLKDSDSTSSKKVSLKEQMQKRMMHEYSSMTSNSSSARSVSSTASTPISGSHQQPPQQQPQVTPQTSKTQPTQAVGSSQVAQQPFVHGQSSPNLVMHTQHARPMSQILQSSPSMHAANAEASTSSNHVATSSSANSGISNTSTTTPSHSSSSTSTPPTTSQNGQS